MRLRLLSSFSILLLLGSFVYSQEYLPQVGVLNFSSENIPSNEVNIIEDFFTSRLVRSNIYNVIDRKNMEPLLKEIEFQLTDLTDAKRAIEIGNILAINYMIIGTVNKLDQVYVLNVQLINVETAQIAGSSVQMFSNLSSLKETIDLVVVELTGLEYSDLSSYNIAKTNYQSLNNRYYRTKPWLITGITLSSLGLLGVTSNILIFKHPMHFTNVFGYLFLGSGSIMTVTSAVINITTKKALDKQEIEMGKYTNISLSPFINSDINNNIFPGLLVTYTYN